MKQLKIANIVGVVCVLMWGIAPVVTAESLYFDKEARSSIEVNNDTLFPEGITYNPRSNRFVLGSFRQGAIFEVDDKGNTHKIIEDEQLRSVFAVRLDEKRNRLLALTSDLGASVNSNTKDVKKYAALAIYELSSGKPMEFIDLSTLIPDANHLVNGMTLDDEGNAYITDSFAAAIYKVDVKGVPSLFLSSERFAGEGINLNGIIFHPEGYLIAIKKSDGVLYKIPLNDPQSFQAVNMNRRFFGGDGVVLVNNNELLVIANRIPSHSSDTVFSVTTQDNWKTAYLIDEKKLGNVYPTTGVKKDGKIYVVHSKLNTLVAAPTVEKGNIRENAIIVELATISR